MEVQPENQQTRKLPFTKSNKSESSDIYIYIIYHKIFSEPIFFRCYQQDFAYSSEEESSRSVMVGSRVVLSVRNGIDATNAILLVVPIGLKPDGAGDKSFLHND